MGSRKRSIPDKINVLLVGGGGREHALALRLKQSKRLGTLWATGAKNPGIAGLARACEEPVNEREKFRLQSFCKKEQIGLVVVGPEDALAAGMADWLATEETVVFGPTREGARIESDKAWAKKMMRAASVPTAEGRVFKDAEGAKAYLATREDAQVVKASGLAGGKGVFVAGSLDEAIEAVDTIMVEKAFGDAGLEIIIEERLKGEEVSVFALVDGRNILVLDSCQDHKRLGDGDIGPNTGGMGAHCPTPAVDSKILDMVQREVIVAIVDAMRRDGIEYRGVLYAGLMLTPGGPKVLEFNARFGDPECQCLLPRIKGDLVEILYATATGQLDGVEFNWDRRAVCCVVLASRGYPGEAEKGAVITGIEEAEAMEGVRVYHAGTRRGTNCGKIKVDGGRVLNVVGQADTIEAARERAYAACEKIEYEGKIMRTDIAGKALKGAKAV